MKSKSLILMVLSLGFGLVAAIGINQVMKQNAGANEPAMQMGPVLVASGALDVKAELTEENVRIENWPIKIIPPEAVTTLEEITDMVTMTRMGEGMPIVAGSIQHKNTIIQLKIPANMKVVAVRVPADGTIGNLLEPGNKVDVIGVFKQRDAVTNRSTTSSRTFLKALQVYSIGNKTSIDNSDDNGKSASKTSIVGLLVTEKQSEALVFVQDTGSIKLVLRGDDVENDGSVGQLEELKKKLLVNEEAFEPQDSAKFGIEIWSGSSSSRTEFAEDGSRSTTKSSESDGNDDSGSDRSAPRGRKSKDDDQANSGNRGDSDRGIGDDQYRGE